MSAFTDPCEASRMRGRCLSSDDVVLTHECPLCATRDIVGSDARVAPIPCLRRLHLTDGRQLAKHVQEGLTGSRAGSLPATGKCRSGHLPDRGKKDTERRPRCRSTCRRAARRAYSGTKKDPGRSSRPGLLLGDLAGKRISRCASSRPARPACRRRARRTCTSRRSSMPRPSSYRTPSWRSWSGFQRPGRGT